MDNQNDEHVRNLPRTDITAHERVDEAARKERNLLRTLIDAMPDNIYVKDQDCRLALVNVAQARNLGLDSPDEAWGKTSFEWYPADVARRIRENDLAVMRTGQTITFEELYVDAVGEERWVSTTKAPLRDIDGNVIGLVGISRDITGSKQAGEALRQANERLRVALKNTGILVWHQDRDLRYT
jgi:PAS domain S-box-containing protein